MHEGPSPRGEEARRSGRVLAGPNRARGSRDLYVSTITFYALADYVGIEAVSTLAGGDHPEVSWVGIALAAFTAATMPALGIAKARVGERLHSSATKSEGRQNMLMLCTYLSVALLIGLGSNALLGAWWLDPVAALIVAAGAVRAGRAYWRGTNCCAIPFGREPEDACHDDWCP
jgi:hypothetical protein